MNHTPKKICAIFFLTLHMMHSIQIYGAPLSVFNYYSLFSMETIKKLIQDYPLLAATITAAISLLGYKRIFYHTSDKKSPVSHDSYDHSIIVTRSTENSTNRLDKLNEYSVTLISRDKEYQFCRVYSYQLSPCGKYLLINQVQEESAANGVYACFVNKVGFREIISQQIPFHLSTYLIDVLSGKIIAYFPKADCTFSNGGDCLIVRCVHESSKIEALKNAIKSLVGNNSLSKRELSNAHVIQYKIYDIQNRICTKIFENCASVVFDTDDNLIVYDDNKTKCFYKKNYYIPFLNRFVKKIIYNEDNEDNEDNAPEDKSRRHIEYYFNQESRSHILKFFDDNRNIFPHKDIDYFRSGENHTLIYVKKKIERTTLEDLAIKVTGLPLQEWSGHIVKLVDNKTGELVPEFNSVDPIVCSFSADKKSVFIVERATSDKKGVCSGIIYKIFNVVTKEMSIYGDGHCLAYTIGGDQTVLDTSMHICRKERFSNVAYHAEVVQQTCRNAGNSLEHKIDEVTNEVANVVDTVINKVEANAQEFADKADAVLEETVKEVRGLFAPKEKNTKNRVYKVDNTVVKNKGIINLLKEGYSRFVFPLYEYNRGWPNKINPQSAKICISAGPADNMKYFRYRSLTKVFSKIIEHASKHQDEIFTIVLQNHCNSRISLLDEIKKMNPEIEKNDSFFTPDDRKNSAWPTIDTIKNSKNILVFQNNQPLDTTMLPFAHPFENNSDIVSQYIS